MFYAYMLQCADGSIYTGHTENLDARLWQHETGYFGRCYTFKRRTVSLLWSQDFGERVEALEAEKRIGLDGRQEARTCGRELASVAGTVAQSERDTCGTSFDRLGTAV